MRPRTRIPVIDLFAGPGGLGEGFSCVRTATGDPCFEIRLSIEKDPIAHQTLELRSLVRTFQGKLPEIYYEYLRGKVSRADLLSNSGVAPQARKARREAWNMTLGPESHHEVSKRVKEALGRSDFWVLIGGPPCQAYSLVGRSRMRADGIKRFEQDARHFLYREYLKILADHAPPIFVMENVKGLLSATHDGHSMFELIMNDLEWPNRSGPRYSIVALTGSQGLFGSDPRGFVVKAERYGIPQARHRVILCGIREDISGRPGPLLPEIEAGVEDALIGLPRIRSRLSKEPDSQSSWLSALEQSLSMLKRSDLRGASDILNVMKESIEDASDLADVGGNFTPLIARRVPKGSPADKLRQWYHDPALGGVTGHTSRSHMRADLHRYFFAAAYARAKGLSPKIGDFPASLLPEHRNAKGREGDIPFADRFRVQTFGRPATTVVSHISKDGHYFIHPDPSQCRSLTVREAARLQTFPDNYHFEGNRTQQFVQIGNAVPPYLAAKIAQSIYQISVHDQGKGDEHSDHNYFPIAAD
ncbi:MAG: DNA cytosine methyltransferase [Burkholderiales bacterium]|nr:DNA cytosine methyltransferase [Burkholderiales bacterium]